MFHKHSSILKYSIWLQDLPLAMWNFNYRDVWKFVWVVLNEYPWEYIVLQGCHSLCLGEIRIHSAHQQKALTLQADSLMEKLAVVSLFHEPCGTCWVVMRQWITEAVSSFSACSVMEGGPDHSDHSEIVNSIMQMLAKEWGGCLWSSWDDLPSVPIY